MSDQKSSAGEPMSDITQEGKMDIDEFAAKAGESQRRNYAKRLDELRKEIESIEKMFPEFSPPSVSVETNTPECSCHASLGDNAQCRKHYPDAEATPLSGEGGERKE